MSEKVRENRVRRAAKRQGCVLTKSRYRDERSQMFGKFFLTDTVSDEVILAGATLDEVEAELNTNYWKRQARVTAFR